MKNKVIVIGTHNIDSIIENTINEELANRWLIEWLYEVKGINSNKIIIVLYKEESEVE